MKLLLTSFCCASLLAFAQAQFKTGIKTRQPPAGNLISEQNATAEQNYYVHNYNRSFVNAETYQGGSGGPTYVDRSTYTGGSAYPSGSYPSGSSYPNGSSYQEGSSYQGGSNYQEGSRYVPGSLHQDGTGYRPYPRDNNYNMPSTRAPLILDATAEFINKTRASMASGICYKEVPTSSLLIGKPSVATVGNGTAPNMSKIQICCEGYERNPHVFAHCDPICKDDCPNGICTAPNTCVCIPGHIRNHEDKCITTCPIGCGNGVCDERGTCQCKPGYELEPTNRQYCLPHCENGCQYGHCVAPNKCDCRDGYHLTAAGTCEPKCDNCDNGKCTAPGVCTCNKGYMKVAGICDPVCQQGCKNGRCVAPDVCECPRGFEIDHSGSNCVAHCDQPCLNGICNGDNSCVCNPGYIQDEYQRNICKPHCPQGCPNGYCTSPNFCVCKPGFVKNGIKGRQSCVPT